MMENILTVNIINKDGETVEVFSGTQEELNIKILSRISENFSFRIDKQERKDEILSLENLKIRQQVSFFNEDLLHLGLITQEHFDNEDLSIYGSILEISMESKHDAYIVKKIKICICMIDNKSGLFKDTFPLIQLNGYDRIFVEMRGVDITSPNVIGHIDLEVRSNGTPHRFFF